MGTAILPAGASPTTGTACRVCSSPVLGGAHEATERMYRMGGRFVYDECQRCGSLSLREVPDDLARYYPENYYSYGLTPSLSPLRRAALNTLLFRPGGHLLSPVAPGRYRAIARARVDRSSRILDIGGGDGRLVDDLVAAGFEGEAVVVDPFARRDRTASAMPIRTDLDDVDGTFDLVMFHHSLEHHPDPARAVGEAVVRLRSGGALVIRVPTVSSECWRRYGVQWVELDAPRHLHVPSERALVEIVERAGLVVERTWRDGEPFQLWASELYREGLPFAGADPRDRFSRRELRQFTRETRRLNRIGEGGRLALLARAR